MLPNAEWLCCCIGPPSPCSAEAYLAKERECLGAQSVLAQVLARKAQVRGAGSGMAGQGGGGCRGWAEGCNAADWCAASTACLRAAPANRPPARRTVQKNVEKIESNLAKLEERLAHEKEKFREYDVVLKQHEERWVGAQRGASGGAAAGGCDKSRGA